MMVKSSTIPTFLLGVIRSYSQIFFSENYWLAIPLIAVSFLDISAGFTGLLAVLTANFAATALKFDIHTISKGLYGFNSLLVGLGLGYYYEATFTILAIAILAGFLTLLITMAFVGFFGKYNLPYLSMPFVISFWIVGSAGWLVSGTETNQSGVYILNKLFSIGGNPLVSLHHWWVENITSAFLNNYFLSLGAIFFQFNIFAGLVVSIALLFYSRIAFMLSLLGYSIAYAAYSMLGMDMTLLGYSFIGFNFILGAIAIGGYFYIPSWKSFFWAIAVTPIIALVAAGLFGLLKPFNLPLLSLPFNLVILSFIYALRYRTVHGELYEVLVQEGTPERNLYSYQSFTKRFPNYNWIKIKLPFLGEWQVSQGHDGEHTHKGEWAHAWDFIITDRDSNQYCNEGESVTDYYCFGQKVVAPADGSVVLTDDGIEDNRVGVINTNKNWGNTVIIKHVDGLYSKLCHLQNGSITVKVGDNVRYGQLIGKVGNSGRSPYPHLHFQLQTTPYIGSKTLKYPLFAYVESDNEIKTFSYPENGQRIKTVEENKLLQNAFNLMHGTKIKWHVKSSKKEKNVTWEVLTNIYNRSYIYCHSTKSTAYFQNDGVFFSFTHFDGDRKSLLYSFYQAAFRIPLADMEKYAASDNLPTNQSFSGWRLFLQDFMAPFFLFLKAKYEVELTKKGSNFDLDSIEYNSVISGFALKHHLWTKKLSLTINKDGSLILIDNHCNTEAICDAY